MTVYHGSTFIVKKPDIKMSKKYLDFGKGFYTTTLKQQAEKWAFRKKLFSPQCKSGIVNVYEMDDLSGTKHLDFSGYTREWLDFVSKCRRGEEIYKTYDVISGAVADDAVFKCVDMYFKGIWDVQRTLDELRFYKQTNQICFVNQEVLDAKLHFISYYEVNNV
ncbi:MAG: DUF3990 domain-containing protein [Spirochaetaceae bacterium]|nr:DUF3990 domain-containing protein [Spirochaetaceae bacterium]